MSQEKKYGVADYNYFKNNNTQQCNSFRQNIYNFDLVVCEVATPFVKRNLNYECQKNGGVKWDLDDKPINLNKRKRILFDPSFL